MFWIIIGAVIALVVMIVLLVMFAGKTGKLEGGLSSCESKGGICVGEEVSCPASTLTSSVFDCKETGKKCCLGTPKECKECPGEDCVEGKWCP